MATLSNPALALAQGFNSGYDMGGKIRDTWEKGKQQYYDEQIADQMNRNGNDSSRIDQDLLSTTYGQKAMGNYMKQLAETEGYRNTTDKLIEERQMREWQGLSTHMNTLEDAISRGDTEAIKHNIELVGQYSKTPYTTALSEDGTMATLSFDAEDGSDKKVVETIPVTQLTKTLRDKVLNNKEYWKGERAALRDIENANFAYMADQSKWLVDKDKQGNTVTLIPQIRLNSHGGRELGYNVLQAGKQAQYMSTNTLSEQLGIVPRYTAAQQATLDSAALRSRGGRLAGGASGGSGGGSSSVSISGLSADNSKALSAYKKEHKDWEEGIFEKAMKTFIGDAKVYGIERTKSGGIRIATSLDNEKKPTGWQTLAPKDMREIQRLVDEQYIEMYNEDNPDATISIGGKNGEDKSGKEEQGHADGQKVGESGEPTVKKVGSGGLELPVDDNGKPTSAQPKAKEEGKGGQLGFSSTPETLESSRRLYKVEFGAEPPKSMTEDELWKAINANRRNEEARPQVLAGLARGEDKRRAIETEKRVADDYKYVFGEDMPKEYTRDMGRLKKSMSRKIDSEIARLEEYFKSEQAKKHLGTGKIRARIEWLKKLQARYE